MQVGIITEEGRSVRSHKQQPVPASGRHDAHLFPESFVAFILKNSQATLEFELKILKPGINTQMWHNLKSGCSTWTSRAAGAEFIMFAFSNTGWNKHTENHTKPETHISRRFILNVNTVTRACWLSVKFLDFHTFVNVKNIYIFEYDWNFETLGENNYERK